MAKCATCGRFVAAKDVAACTDCSNKFHLACAQLKESPKANVGWRCLDCKKRVPLSGNSTTPTAINIGNVSGSSPLGLTGRVASSEDAADFEPPCQQQDTAPASKMDMGHEMRLLRTELQQMREELKTELREIRREVADLRQTVTTCSKRVDSLESRIETLENRHEGATSEGLTSKLEQTVAHLKWELNDREQELLSSDLEIANIPENSGENVIHAVELVARKLGVSLETRDIVFAERVGPKSIGAGGNGGSDESGRSVARRAGDGRRIVVRLARRDLRDELLQSARVRRGATTADLGFTAPPRRFYLNERLTRTNKHLFYRARLAAEQLGWKYSWTKRGRILTKQGDGKRTFSIRSEDDLERVFGCDVLKQISG